MEFTCVRISFRIQTRLFNDGEIRLQLFYGSSRNHISLAATEDLIKLSVDFPLWRDLASTDVLDFVYLLTNSFLSQR